MNYHRVLFLNVMGMNMALQTHPRPGPPPEREGSDLAT
jgi:hypothetical protein